MKIFSTHALFSFWPTYRVVDLRLPTELSTYQVPLRVKLSKHVSNLIVSTSCPARSYFLLFCVLYTMSGPIQEFLPKQAQWATPAVVAPPWPVCGASSFPPWEQGATAVSASDCGSHAVQCFPQTGIARSQGRHWTGGKGA